MKNKKFVIFLSLIFLSALSIFITSSTFMVNGSTEHCPDHENAIKIGQGSGIIFGIEYSVTGATVTFSSPVEFCVKAGNKASGILNGTSFTVNWLNDGDQIPDISYVAIYVNANTETPTLTKTQQNTPTGTHTATLHITGTSTNTPSSSVTPQITKTIMDITETPTPEKTIIPFVVPDARAGGDGIRILPILFIAMTFIGISIITIKTKFGKK